MNNILQRTLLGGLLLTCTAGAAPLFPDVPDSYWATDAVRQLAARGLVEGYPDGTFKGDRAASRFEVAMVLARVLAKMETEHASFATKEELDAVRKLALALKDELAALGVRVTNLEENTSRLDQRVTELERITFYGLLETRITAQSFHNDGAPDNGTGQASNVPFLNYNQIVGANRGAQLRPQVEAVIPVVDYRNGRALVNGVGYTAVARLGTRLRIDEDNAAGVEFAAYTAQGNQNIDAYWGASAPYLANPWTMNLDAAGIPAGQNNQPWTRMVFDHAWYEHKPSKTKVILGAFDSLRMDRFIYVGQSNNNAYGPARFPGFGFQVLGQVNLGEDQDMLYEVFGTRFGDGGNVYQGQNYFHVVFGGDVSYRHDRGDVKLNWVRFYDESPGFHGPLTGLLNVTNLAYLNSPGWTQLQWVNPPGWFAGQRPVGEQVATSGSGAYAPNLIDTRPIPAWNGGGDNAIGLGPGGGNYGSQAQTSYGLSNRYWLPLSDSDKERVNFTFEYGHSDYKSNRNSGYVSSGNMGRVEVAASLLEGDLNLSLQALRVDPNYNPAIFNASLLGIRFVRPYNFLGRFNLHDNGLYPHNREGFLFKGSYQWDRLNIGVRAGWHQQTRTSLYDVRVKGSALGPSIPTNDVIGFAPGFYDTLFAGLAHPNVYGSASGNSFDANLNPLENPRGSVQEYGLNLHYQFDEPNLGLDLAFERNYWGRRSVLTPAQGGSQNQVDLATNYGLAGVSWGFQKDWTARTGLEIVQAVGHHDPGGLYNGYARASGQTNFVNVDSVQTIPYVGLDWQMSKTSSWTVDFRYYTTRDYVNVPAGAGPGTVGATANPFNWSGPQITSCYRMTF